MKNAAFILLVSCAAALGDVRLPAVISDNMVLLQDAPANVWGWAEPGEKVSVKLGTVEGAATADAEGNWSVKLCVPKAGVAGEMTIAGKNTITIKNVAVGEVWLASGQSNMEMSVQAAKDAPAEMAAANFPEIRVFTVPRKGSKQPETNTGGKWEVATPRTAGKFTAVGYFFARQLHEKLKAPIGIIHASWGGTPLETWMPESGMKANPDFGTRWRKILERYAAAKPAYDEAMARYQEELEKAKAESRPAPRRPSLPDGPDSLEVAPMGLFNGMIAPLTPYAIRGAIWYQGESNAGLSNRGSMELYGQLFPTLILSWRFEFAQAQRLRREESDFPFLFVQLANFMPRREEPSDSYWAQIREAQLGTLAVPHTGMAVAIDIGDAEDIHPKNKQEVARRLALSALAHVYFQEVEFSGPLYAGMQVEDDKVRLNFTNSTGLKSRDGGPLKGFALAGEDKKFVWAEAAIQEDHIVVSSPAVKAPVAIRYAWADNPEGNLVNGAGLPASPFRSDDWEQKPPPEK